MIDRYPVQDGLPDIQCRVCKMRRQWDMTDVARHDIGMKKYVFVPHCSDNMKCREKARDRSLWILD